MLWTIIRKTAWPMTPPAPWSAFHVIFLLAGLAAVACLIRLLCPPSRASKYSPSVPGDGLPPAPPSPAPKDSPLPALPASKSRSSPAPAPGLVLLACGLILMAGEIYKQLFLYEVVNEGAYDWWYFPFQLCSTPMYLCLAFPFLPRGRCRQTAAVYLQSFGFLGGVMALLEPSGLMHPYWTLTLHGLVWHIFLIFIACYCTASGLAGRDRRHFVSALLLFFLFCLMATAINLLTVGRADMFYISPYHPITQVVFHEISLALGIWPGIGIYLASICAGAWVSRRLLWLIFRD